MAWLRLDAVLELLTIPRMLFGGWIVLAIAMAVAMRTEWGQRHPLRTCAVLSLVAHLLLALMAATIPLVRPMLPGDEGGAMLVSRLELETGSPQAARSTAETPRWDRFAAADLPEPQRPDPSTNRTPEEPPRQRPAELAPPVEDAHEALAELAPAQLPEAPTPVQTAAAEVPPATAPATAEPSPSRPDPVSEAHVDRTASQVVRTQPDPEPGPWEEPLPTEVPERLIARTEEPASVAEEPEPRIERQLADEPSQAPEEIALALPTDAAPEELAQAMPLDEPSGLVRRATQPTAERNTPEPPPLAPVLEQLMPVSASQRRDPPPLEIASAAAPDIYRHRFESNRVTAATRRGGDAETEQAVALALDWLASGQSSDGRWDAARWGAGQERRIDGQDRGGAGRRADTAVTGLAVLAFLGAGQTPTSGEHREAVQAGLEWLVRTQDSTGHLGGQAETYAFMYAHAMAAFAVCEGYALSRAGWLETPARRAVEYTLRCQDPQGGGWRYYPREAGDTSVLGWQLMTLNSARLAGIPWPDDSRRRTEHFLSRVTGGTHRGLTAYRPGERPTRTMTAEGWFCRQMLGITMSQAARNEATDTLLAQRPGQGQADLYYWYYASLALQREGGAGWQHWNESLKRELLRTQRTEGPLAGSWDPSGRWGGHGGRVYSTAMAALCLEVYYRFAAEGDTPNGTEP